MDLSEQMHPGKNDETHPMPEHGWTCFHCGETFTTPGAAEDHFGFEPSCEPACRIKVGHERGLLMELRRVERDLLKAWDTIHDETGDAVKAMHQMHARHLAHIREVEEEAYARGVADAREQT